MSIRILCVDDNPTIRDLVRKIMTLAFPGGEVEVFVACDGVQGLDYVLQYKPDLVILDVMMPRMDGYQFARLLRGDARFEDIPVIILSRKAGEKDQVMGLRLGADCYLTKPFKPAVLTAYVQAMLRRGKERYKADMEGVLGYAGIVVDRNTRQAYRDHNTLNLTTKEFELLSFFLRHPGQVLSRGTIIEHVWGFNYEGESENIVDVYVGYLRKKLEEYGPRLIHTERGVGFVLREKGARK